MECLNTIFEIFFNLNLLLYCDNSSLRLLNCIYHMFVLRYYISFLVVMCGSGCFLSDNNQSTKTYGKELQICGIELLLRFWSY